VNPFCRLTVLYIAADNNLAANQKEITDETINGVKTITVYYGKVTTGFRFFQSLINFFHSFKAFLKGWKYVISQSDKPQITHVSIAYPAGIFALWLKIFFKIPYIISEHWTVYMPENSHKLSWIEKFNSKLIFSNAALVMPVSKNLQEAIQQGYAPNAKFSIVPNTVDISVFYPQTSNQKPQISNPKKQILHVSTLHEEAKNVFGLFRVLKNLALMRNDFELHIIHEYYSKSHEDYARELGLLNTVVFFHGQKTPGEIAAVMRRSDFFVLFSNYENLPVVLLESLTSGLPVISTDVGGIADHITNEFGILVKPKDETGLLNAMNQMLDHCKEYDVNKLRAYAIKNFSNEVVGQSFSRIYSSLITHNS